MHDRKVYFEYMRIIAAGLVIYNHSAGYHLYMSSNGIQQIIYMVFATVTRMNVPLFFMISGSLLLYKKEDFVTVIKNRISRFVLILFLFSLGLFVEYYIIAYHNGVAYDFTIKSFVYRILSNSIDGSIAYWYLYSYLSFLLALPFIQRIVPIMDKQDFRILFFLHFIFSSLIPMINLFLNVNGYEEISVTGSLSLPFATTLSLFYPLIGYYLDRCIDIKKMTKSKLAILIGACIVGIILSCYCIFCEGHMIGEFTQNYISLFDYVTAIVAFLVIKYIVCVAVPKLSAGKLGEFVCMAGSLTFGIYLLDPYLGPLLGGMYNAVVSTFLPTLFASIGWCVLSMLIGGSLTYLLKKNSVFNKLL